MSEVLYRKYRPKVFAEVMGQDQVISVLQKSIKDKNLGHAYLFYGGRGTGKTTIARIFAAEIGTTNVDLYEIDAASNRGIDDVRELREAVRTSPFSSPYKVYIIDEAHMLTRDAFNALLKTLEEPPPHVIFILATTEKEKLPDTVISRCQTFTFRQPNIELLKKHVISVAKQEGYTLEGPAGEIIAMFGDGSFRDALSVLEKVLAGVDGKKVSEDDAALIIGAPKRKLVNDILAAIVTKDTEIGLRAITEAVSLQVDMKAYLKLILQKIRAVMILRYAPKMESEFVDEFTPDDLVLLKQYATGKDIHSHVLMHFLDAQRDVGISVAPGLSIELALLRTLEKDA